MPPPVVTAEVFAQFPVRLSKSGRPATWVDANHPGLKLDSFLEGPAFDRRILTARLAVAGVRLFSHQ